MADYSISIEKGLEGLRIEDFVVGTQSPNAGTVEVRIEDDDAATRMVVVKALKAITRFIESGLYTTYPKL
jgi:hypothetical protein